MIKKINQKEDNIKVSTSKLTNEIKPKEEILKKETLEKETNRIQKEKEGKYIESEKKPIKSYVNEVKYREVVYLGIADEAERIGAVTRNIYIFKKDIYKMPVSTQIDERDYPGLIAEKGKGCARRNASILFMSKLEWDLEIEQARVANSA